MLKASMNLRRLLWIYYLLLHTPFVFTPRSKRPPLDILNFLFNKLRNQDNKVAFIRVDEDVALERYYEFMSKCHNINIIVKTTGEDAYSLNGKIESHNKTLSNITRTLLLNSSNKK